ncbi:MAG TPA: ATP-binding protein [Lysobacter sp.]
MDNARSGTDVASFVRDVAAALLAGMVAALAYGLPSQVVPMSAGYAAVLVTSLSLGGRCGMFTVGFVLLGLVAAKGSDFGWLEGLLFVLIGGPVAWLATLARQRGGVDPALQQDFIQRFQSDRQQRALLDNLPKMVWIAEPDGTTRYRNRFMDEYGGLVGDQDWRALVSPDELAAVVRAWEESLAQARPLTLEVGLRRADDGQYRWHLVKGVPIADDTGRVQCWYGTATDIEDQKRALETLELANQRTSRFLAVLGHELCNPMAGMTSACELLQRPDIDEAQRRDALVLLHRQNLHLRRMIDDLLDISRVTQGKVELRREHIELVGLMEEVHHDNLSFARSRGVALEHPTHLARCNLHVDKARMRQVMDNLVTNAIKASAPGQHVRMEVECLGHETAITVSDDGQGLDPESADRMFQPFVQATAWESHGLGLGLSIVRHLVELHGGRVTAHSEGPDRGSTFRVYLPCTGTSAGAPDESADEGAVPRMLHAGTRVLLVEDETDNAEALRTLLTLEGLQVSIAGNAESALLLADRQPFDVVLCDLELRDGPSGFDVARALSAREATPYLIAYTGYGQRPDIERTRQAGFHRHLVKPASLADILSAIEEGLQSNRRPSHAGPSPTVTT